MFKKINAPTKPISKQRRNLPPHYPVLPAEKLLLGKKCEQYIEKIKMLANVPDKYWQSLYLPVITQYADFVQGLPALKYEAFNKHNGLLELGLRRTAATLMAYKKDNPSSLKAEDVPVKTAQLIYALFTAGFFYNLGQIVAVYWVALCDKKGLHGKRWNPMAGFMKDQGTHYRYSFELSVARDALANFTTPLIAQALMPAAGFSWLASNHELFHYWLALLQNDTDVEGIIAKMVLPRESSLLQLNTLEDPLIASHGEHYLDYEAHDKTELNGDKPVDTQELAETFIHWLRENIDSGKNLFSVNQTDSLIHYTTEGYVLVYPEILNQFMNDHVQYKNKDIRQIQFDLQKAGITLSQFTAVQNRTAQVKLAGMAGQAAQNKQALIISDPTLLGSIIAAANKFLQVNISTGKFPEVTSATPVGPRFIKS